MGLFSEAKEKKDECVSYIKEMTVSTKADFYWPGNGRNLVVIETLTFYTVLTNLIAERFKSCYEYENSLYWRTSKTPVRT